MWTNIKHCIGSGVTRLVCVCVCVCVCVSQSRHWIVLSGGERSDGLSLETQPHTQRTTQVRHIHTHTLLSLTFISNKHNAPPPPPPPRTELWSCCNAYDRLMVTRQNTNQNQSLTYEVERKRKRKVDQALWEMLPQTVPWSKGSLSRCAVVGSGGILQNSRCGAEIDNSDYVIRFNLAPINKSYDVGVKTDLITANPTQINKGYPGLQLNPGPLAEALSVYGHAHLLLPAFSFAFGTSPCFKVYQALRKARSQQKVVFFHPDYLFELGRFWRRRGQRAPRLSTGLMLASTALEICEQVHLYGFWPFPLDLSQNTLPHHYYDSVGPSHFMHAMPEEFLLLLQLHSQGALQLHVGPCTP
uniref:ST8 alpha-N-acetyl-neuraminide alpha-2,8-sialyltransferase 6 n=1 Tax=Oncorhynchus mykiss TaxID=8022 RepID=A0A8K9WKZ7_ONCMY